MPRTKVSKSSKRNRDNAIEEKIRDFEKSVDEYVNLLERIGHSDIADTESDMKMLLQGTSSVLLNMKVCDLLAMNLDKFSDWKQDLECLAPSSFMNASQSICNTTTSSVVRPAKSSNPNDEGYLTEDSSTGASGALNSGTLVAYTSLPYGRIQQLPQEQLPVRGRTPGPLSSSRARRPRRSRSACGDYVPGSALKSKSSSTYYNSTTGTDRASRNNLRTPSAPRAKALSADRSPKVANTSPNSPVTAFMRWPKPGELVLSTCGSPVVAQVLPDKFANVNIPVKNGVLSLRPKKLSELRPDFIEDIDTETLNQIKTLHANLNLIVRMADKAAALK